MFTLGSICNYTWAYLCLHAGLSVFTRGHICLKIAAMLLILLYNKAPNTTIAEFANTVDPDETAHIEPSHLELQCLPTSLFFFNTLQFILKAFRKVCRRNFVVCFFGALWVNRETSRNCYHMLRISSGDQGIPGSNPARTVGFFSAENSSHIAHLHPCV